MQPRNFPIQTLQFRNQFIACWCMLHCFFNSDPPESIQKDVGKPNTLWKTYTKNYGKSPFSMGKSTISMAFFSSFLLVYQRVNEHHVPFAMACPHRFCMEKTGWKIGWQSLTGAVSQARPGDLTFFQVGNGIIGPTELAYHGMCNHENPGKGCVVQKLSAGCSMEVPLESPSYWLLKWANVPILPWSHQGLGSFQRFLRKPVLRIQWCLTSHLYSLGINEHPLNIRHIDLQNILSLCCFVANCPCQKSKSSREFCSWILLVADLRKANCQDCPAAQCCSRPAAGG